MIKKLVKKAFHSLGYNLVSLKPTTLRKSMIKGEIPLYIEFMGPSGVGKSTLLKEVCKIYDNNLNWLTPTEFIQLENPIIRNEIFSSTYQEIIKYKINKITSHDFLPSIHLELLSFFYENIKEIALVHYYNKNCTILFDEGLFHNFSDCLLDLHHTNNEKFNSVISNTAIVFCKASPETIAHHILERNRLFSILHSFHQNKNFVELIEYQINSLKLIDSRIEFFKHCNIPILEINTSDDLKKNAIKVNEFIKKHSK